MAKLVLKSAVPGRFTVELWRSGDTLEVRYGHPDNTKSGLSYGEAAKAYGYAVFHAIQCETGALDGVP